MVRFLVRLAGLFALAGAVIAIIIDGTRSIAASALVTTPLAEAWRSADAGSLAAAEAALGGSMLTSPFLTVLALPAWLVFGALGALLILAARPARLRAVA